ncbi:DUF3068 domain-containing protein [Corynebacterium yudongzhengii]|uniref:DUF3068 domain-containing protein n=1 Tax=Corynebacterium yudongzhengii TaxID=2080740 RepID=A0A2U1T9R9_9CORY|nr:DUF3068 domain-containing protein [Corynebacterium yudongzhengii]AWB81200.1 DUF3068 domain-containing protein [Corynebacterium yudongzhengii]PWC02739.1 DUF3068 domain-containing protein [Corynebacterium yudongzhengii]
MLPKSRIISALLVGLGIALIVGGLMAPRLIDSDGRLPLDLENSTWTLTDDSAATRLLTDPNGRVLETPVTRQLHLQIGEPATADTASVRVGTTLMRDSLQEESDRLITASTWGYEMDRVTGEATTPANLTHTIGMPPEEVEVDGVWMKFPTDAEQTTYDVFDDTLRESRPATFIDSQEIDGRTIYHYRQEIEPTNVAFLYESFLNTAPVGDQQGALYHSATTDFYVDQITGLVVDIETEIYDFYAVPGQENDEQARETFLQFTGSREDAQVDATLAEIDDISGSTTAELIRWSVVAVGVVITVLGLLGAFLGNGAERGKTRQRRRIRGRHARRK